MLNVVVDTNIIISAALTPTGNAEKIIDIVADGKNIQLFYSADILLEYEEVLSRQHLKIEIKKQNYYIETIKAVGIEIEPTVSDILLPDESDRIFYDAAREAVAILITGNKKHFPQESFIMTPAEFLPLFKDA